MWLQAASSAGPSAEELEQHERLNAGRRLRLRRRGRGGSTPPGPSSGATSESPSAAVPRGADTGPDVSRHQHSSRTSAESTSAHASAAGADGSRPRCDGGAEAQTPLWNAADASGAANPRFAAGSPQGAPAEAMSKRGNNGGNVWPEKAHGRARRKVSQNPEVEEHAVLARLEQRARWQAAMDADVGVHVIVECEFIHSGLVRFSFSLLSARGLSTVVLLAKLHSPFEDCNGQHAEVHWDSHTWLAYICVGDSLT